MHTVTPLLEAKNVSAMLGKKIFCKMDNQQPSGSFKIRGIGLLCKEEAAKGAKAFVASSGGNAGIAVAYAAQQLHLPCTVFVPQSSHQAYIDAIQYHDAKVIVAGKAWDDAHQAALTFAEQHQAAYIPPFDHPTLWLGHSTMIDETAQQCDKKPYHGKCHQFVYQKELHHKKSDRAESYQ